MQSLPFYGVPQIEDVPQSTPKKDEGLKKAAAQKGYIEVDLDKDLNQSDRENLQDMSLDLPSIVQTKGSYAEVLKQIETKNRSLGQFLGVRSKSLEGQKVVDASRQQTLKKYKNSIKNLEGAQQFIKKSGEGIKQREVLVKQKRGPGRPKTVPDVVYYNNEDELVEKLQEYILAYDAGNTGVHNHIVGIMNTMLDKKTINKQEYDEIHKTIFNKS